MSYRSKPEAIKCLEENIGENLHDLGLVNEFLKHDTKTEIYEKKKNKKKTKKTRINWTLLVYQKCL